jgi:hypothetical protein
MQCLPGELGARDPYNMRRPMTEPFRIRWITKGDMPVFVGRNILTELALRREMLQWQRLGYQPAGSLTGIVISATP